MIVSRYLRHEILLYLIATTVFLLLFFMSDHAVRYLVKASSGQLALSTVFYLMMLELPYLLGLLLPLSLFLSIILAYGRLQANHEWVVLQSSGFSNREIFLLTLKFGLWAAVFVFFMIHVVGPYVAQDKVHLLFNRPSSLLIDNWVPGQFQVDKRMEKIVYLESKETKDQGQQGQKNPIAHRVFAAHKNAHAGWDMVLAQHATFEDRGQEGEIQRYLLAQEGQLLQEDRAGDASFALAHFKEWSIALFRLFKPVASLEDIRALPTWSLYQKKNQKKNQDKRYQIEWSWRLSLVIMTVVLACLAFPLSILRPRSGQYAAMLPGLACLIAYANGMFIWRHALKQGFIPVQLGFGLLHGFFVILTLVLMFVRGVFPMEIRAPVR